MVKTSVLQSIFQTIKQALSGDEQDYTKGSINLAVILLAIPMILELSLESVFAVVDIFFVSKLGANAIATVGLTESVITLIYSLAIGLSTAATAIIARRVGEKNPTAAAHAGAQSFVVTIVIVLLLSILGVIYAPSILAFMGGSQEVITEGSIFTRIMFGGSISIVFLFLINGIFRGAGNAAMAMKSLWIASILNIMLCPILIHFLGLKGAAIATVIGRSTGVLYQCYHLFLGKGTLRFLRKYFRFDWQLIKSIIAVAWPATLQFLIASGSWIVLTRLIAETGGTVASAGYQISFRNFAFFILPAWGLSNAAATLVGQNLGAKQVARAEESVMITAKYNVIFMAFVSILFVAFPHAIISVFTQDPAIIEVGALASRVIGFGYIFYGVGMVMSQALNGAGDTRMPTLINFICFWLFQIPFAYLLAQGFNLGYLGAFIAIPTSQALVALVSWWYFKRGNWKAVTV